MERETFDQRWPPKQVPADLEAEANRLLHWAHHDPCWQEAKKEVIGTSGASRDSIGPTSAAHGSSYLGGRDDPWQDILYAADAGGFCEVPVSLLRRLRKEGEAQLAEIAELRAQLAKLPDLEEEVVQMEAELQELQSNCVVNSNEIELRKLEAETLEDETRRLQDEKEERVKRLETLNAQADEIEFWLDAAGHAPVGPEGRARVERYKAAAAHAAAEHAQRFAVQEADGEGASGRKRSTAVVLLTPSQWKELFQREEVTIGEVEDLERFFVEINPTGRSMTGEELKAAAGNPQLGLSRHLRGLVATVTSETAEQAATEQAAASPAEGPSSIAEAPEAVAMDKPTEKPSEAIAVTQPLEGQPSTMAVLQDDKEEAVPTTPTPGASSAVAEVVETTVPTPVPEDVQVPTSEVKMSGAEEAEEEEFFTKDEWMEFFQEDGDLSPEDLKVLDVLLVKMDTSGDGQISPDEISEALANPNFEMPQAVREKLIDFMKTVG